MIDYKSMKTAVAVAALTKKGKSTSEIAAILELKPAAIRWHIRGAFGGRLEERKAIHTSILSSQVKSLKKVFPHLSLSLAAQAAIEGYLASSEVVQ